MDLDELVEHWTLLGGGGGGGRAADPDASSTAMSGN